MPDDQWARDTENSPVFQFYARSIERIMKEQGPLSARLRQVKMPAFPWPATDNEMLAYLRERAFEVHEQDGLDAMVTWLAAHAWFEGAIDALSDPRRP